MGDECGDMSQLDALGLETARDLKGRGAEVWIRRGLVIAFAIMPVLALFNVFGQAATVATASSPVAKLTVRSPTHARGGLLYEVRFTIEARENIKNATLALGGGWANGLTINTIEPSPTNETSKQGDLRFELGSIDAGETFVLHMQFQVNPTTSGSRAQQVALLDGEAPLVSVDRHLTVFP
jgi:hypothetical protein